MVTDTRDQAGRDIGIHQGWRAATKENRIQNPRWGERGEAVNLKKQGITPTRLINGFGYVGIEIAIGAFGLAKWPMNIKPEAPVLPILSQSNLLRIAPGHGPGG